MEIIFDSMYCWFEEFFGIDLRDYLWGLLSPEQTTDMFIGIGLSMVGISIAIAVIFYYVVNHPRLNQWWGWGIFFVINAIVNFIVGWQWVLGDYKTGLMYQINSATKLQESLPISESDILCFGVSNMFLSMFVFIVISYIIKWGSVNCSRAPF